MIYTGVDGNKTYSISYSIIKKRWVESQKLGKRIYLVPSDMSLIIHRSTNIKDPQILRKTLSIEFEDKFGSIEWDVKLRNSEYCAVLLKGFERPKNAYALDAEVHALMRSAVVNDFINGYIIDIGKRKTTLILLEDGKLGEYRVILKGGSYIEGKVREYYGDSGLSVIREKGIDDQKVMEAFGTILGDYLEKLSESKVFLSGGWSRLKGVDSLFNSVYRNKYVKPEFNSAFGCAIKYVVQDCSPDFRGGELSPREIKRYLAVAGFSIVVFAGSLLGLRMLGNLVIADWREEEKRSFVEKYPDLPPIAVRDQVKSFVSQTRFPLLTRFQELSLKLEKGIKIYSFEYSRGVLKVTGEGSSKKLIDKLNPKKIKETTEGSYEFEVELK